MPDPVRPRFTLRDLPLPAKLVVTMFLISVGVGYFSALVQLHMQHSTKNGEPMPTVGDVIEKFSGLKEFDPTQPMPGSKLETILAGPADGGFDKNNMTPAFYAKSSGYDKEVKADGKEAVDALRAGEHAAFVAWVKLDPDARRAAYDDNKFVIAADAPAVTEEFYDPATRTVAVKDLIDSRCAKCHSSDQKPEIAGYADLEPLATAPKPDLIDGKWLKSTRQVSVEGLTQSTHAHLLSFSMLFSLTGLVFAFTSYPAVMRATLGPVVLVAQLLDISCWWLARLDGVGPTFATMIIGTGGVVGLGLAGQIVLSLFNLYGAKGKAALVVVALAAAGAFGTLVVTVIEPTLKAERLASETPAADAKPAKVVVGKVAEGKVAKDEGPAAIPAAKE